MGSPHLLRECRGQAAGARPRLRADGLQGAPRWHSECSGPFFSSEFTHGIDRSQIRRYVDEARPSASKNVAKRVTKWARAGHQMIVVPSAMSGETNRLLGLAQDLAPSKPSDAHGRELDMLAATGEQASSALLAIALQAEGMEAVSYAGAGRSRSVPTTPTSRRASRASTPNSCWPASMPASWPVVAGFQGVDEDGSLATLGRGGSDTPAWRWPRRSRPTSARSIPTSMVSTPPTRAWSPRRRRLDKITFEEMLEMASLGSKVLQIRSVEFAGKYKVPLRVVSSFTP